jgi:hypothetical protein
MMVAIALPCKISSGTCSRFTPQIEHLLQSWQMDLSLLGATRMMVAIALPCKISSGICRKGQGNLMVVIRLAEIFA